MSIILNVYFSDNLVFDVYFNYLINILSMIGTLILYTLIIRKFNYLRNYKIFIMENFIDNLFTILQPNIKRTKITNINKMLCCSRCLNEIGVITKYELYDINDVISMFANVKHTELLINQTYISEVHVCGCIIREILCSKCFLVLGSTKLGPEKCVCSLTFNHNNCLFYYEKVVLINIVE